MKNQTSERLTQDQILILIQGLKDKGKYRDAIYVLVSYSLGLRAGDVLNLTWDKLSNNGVIKHQLELSEQKTGKVRIIPLNSSLRGSLQRYYDSLDTKYHFVFTTPKNVSITVRGMNKNVKGWNIDYLKCAVDHLSTHSFRKSFGFAYWDLRGRTEEALVELMNIFNHSSLKTTIKYIGITADITKKAYSVVELKTGI